jgi:cytochrome c peroxidase
VRFLFDVGTFDPNAFNEARASGTDILVANGSFGFNIPSLISVFATAPYLHNGGAQTLEEVLQNVTHRSAGTGGIDTLHKAAHRKALIQFLKSIDAETPIFP